MMEYGIAGGSAITQDTAHKVTPLDRLSDHANAAGRTADLIAQFIERFRAGPEQGCGSDGDAAKLSVVRVSHIEQMDRLEKNLARAEELARELNSLG